MPTLEQALETFLDEQRARLNSEKTIRDYADKISIWLSFAGETTLLEDVTTQHLRKYIGHCRERGLARETIRSYITALKVAWSFWSDEYGIEDVMKRIKKPIRKQGKPKSIKPKDFIAVFEAAKGRHRIDWRNRAMLAVLADTGVRRGELLTMTTEIDVIKRRCPVVGKTGERTVFWTHYTNRLLVEWLSVRPRCNTESLWISMQDGREHAPLTGSGVVQILKRLRKKAGVKGRVNPHAYRHRFAQEYIKNGGDIIKLAKLGGWQDLRTIQDAYTVFDEDELAKMHEENSPLLSMLEGEIDKN